MRDTSLVQLRADGNGIAALRTTISVPFVGVTAAQAIGAVARLAGVPISVDSTLPNLRTVLRIPAHGRTAAVALLEIGAESRMRAQVGRGGQVVLTDASNVALPGLRVEAVRVERNDFQTGTNVGMISMSAEALRASPTFVEPDVLRSLQTLPGIEARSDYAAGFNVRGGEADQTLVLLDGYPIYNPFHLGGVFSTFIESMVGRVEMRTGALPARFGGRLSGVLDVRSADPVTPSPHGRAAVSLVSSSASVGQTFAQGTAGWMVGARRTYADAVANLIEPNSFPYHFQDAQARVAADIGRGFRLSGTAYAGKDIAAPNDVTDGFANWSNALAGATLSKRVVDVPRLLGDSLMLEQRASMTRFNAGFRLPTDLFDAANAVTDARFGGSIAAHRASATTTVGYELARQRTSYRASASLSTFADLLPVDTLAQVLTTTALFADHVWRPTPRLLLDFGARWESVAGAAWTGFSPRVSAKYFITDDIALTAGGGRYAQWTHSLGREEELVRPLQFWVGSDSFTPVSRASDAVVGIERWITPSRLLHVEAFHKRYDRVAVANRDNDPLLPGDAFTPTTGSSRGVDVLLRQLEGARFTGWLAYTYAFGTRLDAKGIRYTPTQARRHNLNLVGSWRGPTWTLGARVNVASGIPVTPVLGGFIRQRYDPASGRWIAEPGDRDVQLLSGPRNSARLPWYERVDVSATRAGRLFGVPLSPYVSVLNVLNARNPVGYVYDEHSGSVRRTSLPNLPFTPTFGVTFAF